MSPQYILQQSLCRESWQSPRDAAALRSAQCEIENLGYASHYCEPGYETPTKGILFANWNHFCSEAGDALERAGFACEWSDEWITCEDCGGALRIAPDSFFWSPSYAEEAMQNGEALCKACYAAANPPEEPEEQTLRVRLCDDCTQMAVNGEWHWGSATDEEFQARSEAICKGLAGLGPTLIYSDNDGDTDFSWAPCDCCKSPLGGNRTNFEVL